MSTPEEQRSVISIRTALLLFAALAAFAFLTLRGPALLIALLIVLALAAKAFLHHLRRRIE